MKILHVANFSLSRYGNNYYSYDYKLTNGFIRNGHYVYNFSYRDTAKFESLLKRKKLGARKMNIKLLDTIKNIHPDLLLLGQSELIDPTTLKKAREIYPKLRIALWFVDTIKGRDDGKIEKLLPLIENIDSFFCTSAGPLLSQFKPLKRACYLPNITDKSIDVLKNHHQSKFEYDMVFIGSDRHDETRREYLKQLLALAQKTSLRIKCFGSQGNPPVYGDEYFKALKLAPMSLSIGRIIDVKWYTSDRIAQLTGNGLLTFSTEVLDYRSIFGDDEIVYFNDINDLIEKALFYKKNQTERMRIATNGYEKTHRCYNEKRIAKYIEEETFDTLSESYEWLED